MGDELWMAWYADVALHDVDGRVALFRSPSEAVAFAVENWPAEYVSVRRCVIVNAAARSGALG